MKTIKTSKTIKVTKFKEVIDLNLKNEFFIFNGLIKDKLSSSDGAEIIDCSECVICPGFIDPQINGFLNFSFWDFKESDFPKLDNVRKELAFCGVVGFLPTLITDSEDKILHSIDLINKYNENSNPSSGARILGIHIEGIFISKLGVHNKQFARKDLTVRSIEPYVKKNVILFTLAPELDKSGEVISFLRKKNITVSAGHSDASYKEGIFAIKNYGLDIATHMFNAMRGVKDFNHRDSSGNVETLILKLTGGKTISPSEDGIMLALLEDKNVLSMVIADGVHVNKESVKLLKKHKTSKKFALVSDLVCEDFFKTSKENGILGGGLYSMDKLVKNLIEWKISDVNDCLACASKAISNHLRPLSEKGFGKNVLGQEANIVIWDTKNNSVKGTIIGENVFLNY